MNCVPNSSDFFMGDTMKKTILFSIFGIFALALSGCATWPSDPAYVEVVDYQKIGIVERWARSNNTHVIWVTTPMRKVPAAGT